MLPFVIRLFDLDIYQLENTVWVLSEQEMHEVILNLPQNCSVLEGALRCHEVVNIPISDDFRLSVNDNSVIFTEGIHFQRDGLILVAQEQVYKLSYSHWEGIDFEDFRTNELENDFFTTVAAGLRQHLIVPNIINMYRSGFLMLLVYSVTVSGLAMLLKFQHVKFPSYKEVFNLILFSSVLPVIVTLVIGLFFTPAFLTIIYNIGTPFWAYAVYKKHIVPIS